MNKGECMKKVKKERVPTNIDKEVHQRIKQLIRKQPELGYNTLSKFLNETLKERLTELENEEILERMKKIGLHNFINENKSLQEKYDDFEDHVIEEFQKMIKEQKKQQKVYQKELDELRKL